MFFICIKQMFMLYMNKHLFSFFLCICIFLFFFLGFLDKNPFCIIHIKCYGKKQLHLV